MPLTYETGKEIQKGDHVTFHGNPGQIELVGDPDAAESATKWYLEEYGPGVLVNEERLGHTYVTPDGAWEDLVFVSKQRGAN